MSVVSGCSVVDFDKLDLSNVTFLEPKSNAHGGSFVPIRYDGMPLYVKYKKLPCPFGVTANTDDMSKTEDRGKYEADKKVTGYRLTVALSEDNSLYSDKAREIDEFMIANCVINSVLWGLGGSRSVSIDEVSIRGYDDAGFSGKWKRMLKWAYRVNKTTKERDYTGDPPKLEFGLSTTPIVYKQHGDEGFLKPFARFTTRFFGGKSEDLEPVDTFNVKSVIPPGSEAKMLAQWGGMYVGSWGASIKPRVKQVMVFPKEEFGAGEILLSEEEDSEEDVPTPLSVLSHD